MNHGHSALLAFPVPYRRRFAPREPTSNLLQPMKYTSLILTLSLICAVPALAQDVISTDRPDFTESPATVQQGTVQGEFGFTQQTMGDASSSVVGEGLVRYGLKEALELRVGVPSHISGDGMDGGLSDASLGFKWTFGRFGDAGMAALITTITLPTGDDLYTSDEVEPGFILVAGQPLTDRLGIAAQVSASFLKLDDEWKGSYMATAVVSGGVVSNLSAFGELRFDAPPLGADEQAVLHTGVPWLFSDDLQVDAHVGFGITDDAPDSFFGFGVAFRR